jgi:8-oxo-dGTP pyrophosphatase MutT (NUDIX family)
MGFDAARGVLRTANAPPSAVETRAGEVSRATTAPSRYAGIIPFASHEGVMYVLLAEEAWGRDAGQWSGFGGGIEPGLDGSDADTAAVNGAAREGYEESLGMLGSEAQLRRILSTAPSHHKWTSEVYFRGGGSVLAHQFLVKVGMDWQLPADFAERRAKKCAEVPAVDHQSCKVLEKSRVQWVSLDDLVYRTARLQQTDGSPLRLRFGFTKDLRYLRDRLPKLLSHSAGAGPSTEGGASDTAANPMGSCTVAGIGGPCSADQYTRFAGIVPFAFHRGTIYVLLGKEAYGKDAGQWSGFGGWVQPATDGDEVEVAWAKAAARKGSEESLAMFASEAGLYHILAGRSPDLQWSSDVYYPGGACVSARQFLIKIPMDWDLPAKFAQLRETRSSAVPKLNHRTCKSLRKSCVQWVRLDKLTDRPSRLQQEDGSPMRLRFGFIKADIRHLNNRLQKLADAARTASKKGVDDVVRQAHVSSAGPAASP